MCCALLWYASKARDAKLQTSIAVFHKGEVSTYWIETGWRSRLSTDVFDYVNVASIEVPPARNRRGPAIAVRVKGATFYFCIQL